MQRTRKALLACLLVATAVALGYALAGVPNIELMTVSIFVSGYLLGPGLGALSGIVAIALYSTFNPLGAALPPLLAAQMAGFGLIGFCGATVGPLLVRCHNRVVAGVVAGSMGLVLTLFYQIVTNLAGFLLFTSEKGLIKYVWAGLVFTAMHLVWNTALFSLILVPILRVTGRYREELS